MVMMSLVESLGMKTKDHSFPRQILSNSVDQFAIFLAHCS